MNAMRFKMLVLSQDFNRGRDLTRVLNPYGFLRPVIHAMMIGLVCLVTPIFTASANAQISAQQIYENPDNHDLNLEFAKQQILRGEMLDAASALERMLYANPNWHSARLLYSAVLYRLDDQQAALRELEQLEGRELNAEQEAKLETYKLAFQTPPKPFTPSVSSSVRSDYDGGSTFTSRDKIQGQVALHLRADDNAGNALTDARFGFENQGDVSAVVKVRARAFIPATEKITVRGEIGGHIRRHETYSQADYDVIDGSIGLSLKEDKTVASIDLDARQINISGESYLRQIGPRITLSQKLSDKTYGTVSASTYNQDFDNLSNASREELRDGNKLSLQAGVLHKLDKRNKVRLALAYEKKTATLDSFAYSGPVLAGAIDHKLNENMYLKAQGKIRWLNFDNDVVRPVSESDEERYTGRLAVGRKLDWGKTNADIKSAAIELGVNWNKRGAEIDTNDYENLGVDIRLTLGL